MKTLQQIDLSFFTLPLYTEHFLPKRTNILKRVYKLLFNFSKLKGIRFMEETRVAKYKKYRQSLTKDNSPVLETTKSNKKKVSPEKALNTTSTLPIDQVIDTIEEDKKQVAFLKKRAIKKILIISSFSFGAFLIVAGLVWFAIVAFR